MKLKQIPDPGELPPVDYRARMTQDSALHWFPPLVEAGLPVPRTAVVPFEPDDMFNIVDGEPPSADFPKAAFIAAVERIGVPCFVRTDLSSAKHDGPAGYRLDTAWKTELVGLLARLFEENVLKMMFEMPLAFMFREWIDFSYRFTAFRGHRIAREWRLFVEDDKVTDRYFYWPWGAIKDHLDPADGLDVLAAYKSLSGPLTVGEQRSLDGMARKAAEAAGGGGWSVDFAQDTSSRWWLIDMAQAKSSWRPE